MVTIKELFNEYNVDSDDIPKNILNIELDEELKHFSKGYKNKDIYYFKGEYHPVWMEDNEVKLNVELIVDLHKFTKKETVASIEFSEGVEPSMELDNTLFTKFISEEVVTFTQFIKNNFTSTTTYSILGNIIRES